MAKDLKGLFSTDQHNLHPHTPTIHVLSNLSNFYYRDNNLADIDLNLLGGDFFDGLAMANDPSLVLCHRWIKTFLEECHKNKVYTRILEGTSSHDRGQPECFDVLKPKDSPYIKYINTLSIERIEELDLTIMYVPDNMGKVKTEVIYERAIELLANQGLTQVDIILLHGGFEQQLPPMANKHGNLYNSIKWQALAKHVIFSGHIHKPWEYGKIRGGGSFDRIAFGEMHPKGAYRFNIKDDKIHTEFWINKNALVYDTIRINRSTTNKELYKIIDAYLTKKPKPKTQIKIEGGDSSVVGPVLAYYREAYTMYGFDAANAKEDNVEMDDSLYDPENYKGVVLNKENLQDNLFSFMKPVMSQLSDVHPSMTEDYLAGLLTEAMEDV